jgi:hypothetical protein
MALLINQQVIRLKVSVDNPPLMEMLYSQDNFSQIFLDPIFRKAAQYLDERRAVASIEILHDKI